MCALGKHRVQAAPSLLDPWKVKTCRIADCLYEIGIRRVGVGSRNGSVLPHGKRGNGVAEFIPEIGVASAAAVSGPEIGVNAELCEIGEASESLVRSCGLARGESTEGIKIDRVRPFGSEVGVQKNFVAQFVFGVIGDVLVHVSVKLKDSIGVSGVSAGGLRGISGNQLAGEFGDFSVLDTCEFVVLQPDIALDDFRRGDETKDRGIALTERPTLVLSERGQALGQQSGTGRGCGSG